MKTLMKFVGALLLATAGMQAQALLVTPSDAIFTGSQTSTSQIEAYLDSIFEPDLTELYKANVSTTTDESGPYSGSYSTVFSNTATDPSDATISYDGGSSISCPECYLLVKDGNHDPAWYLIDIASWNGTDDIVLEGFWPNGGAISHVSIYGRGQSVPEPAPLALLAAGLIGMGLRRLKKSS